ncbi:MAG: nicotinate-nicotinamide nucleotide adenylyltransferase, partial [Clostridia bacterium]|nr:nicotinate-nicotinamide nucleotide adenylyltransferase [Clostridia bacterium]
MKRIALFGGTFNPFHNAHFEMLEAVVKSNLADEILLVPTKLPPHKECDFLADETHRLKMCALAAQHFANVTACDMELKMQGKSYTFNTVSELKRSSD